MRCPRRYNYHVGKLGTEPGLLTESVYCPAILALLRASCLPLSKFPKLYMLLFVVRLRIFTAHLGQCLGSGKHQVSAVIIWCLTQCSFLHYAACLYTCEQTISSFPVGFSCISLLTSFVTAHLSLACIPKNVLFGISFKNHSQIYTFVFWNTKN